MISASILLGSFAIAGHFVSLKKLLERIPRPWLVIGITHLVASIFLLPSLLQDGAGSVIFQSAFLIPLLLTVSLTLLSRQWHMRALQTGELAAVASYSALTPLLSLLTAWAILDELPTLGGLVGMGIVALSVYCFHLSSQTHWLAPILELRKNRTAQLGLLAAIPPAFGLVFQKQALQASDIYVFSFWMLFSLSAMALAMGWLTRKESTSVTSFIPYAQIATAGVLLAGAQVCFSYAAQSELVPYFGALNRSSIFFQVVLAHVLIATDRQLKWRAICSLGIVVGFFIIRLHG
jgi:drug/metabolite transporter (DMT)-like permease